MRYPQKIQFRFQLTNISLMLLNIGQDVGMLFAVKLAVHYRLTAGEDRRARSMLPRMLLQLLGE